MPFGSSSFTFSDKSDSVGFLSNHFPASIAVYNLVLEKHRLRTEVHPHNPRPAGG